MKELLEQIEEHDVESARLKKELWQYSREESREPALDVIPRESKEKDLEFEHMM